MSEQERKQQRIHVCLTPKPSQNFCQTDTKLRKKILFKEKRGVETWTKHEKEAFKLLPLRR